MVCENVYVYKLSILAQNYGAERFFIPTKGNQKHQSGTYWVYVPRQSLHIFLFFLWVQGNRIKSLKLLITEIVLKCKGTARYSEDESGNCPAVKFIVQQGRAVQEWAQYQFIKSSRGPKMDPWGLRISISLYSEKTSFMKPNCFWFSR